MRQQPPNKASTWGSIVLSVLFAALASGFLFFIPKSLVLANCDITTTSCVNVINTNTGPVVQWLNVNGTSGAVAVGAGGNWGSCGGITACGSGPEPSAASLGCTTNESVGCVTLSGWQQDPNSGCLVDVGNWGCVPNSSSGTSFTGGGGSTSATYYSCETGGCNPDSKCKFTGGGSYVDSNGDTVTCSTDPACSDLYYCSQPYYSCATGTSQLDTTCEQSQGAYDSKGLNDCTTSPNPSCVTNGQCGLANAKYSNIAPTSNLCAAGYVGSGSGGNNDQPWTWTCVGYNGGSTASCYAPSSYLYIQVSPTSLTLYPNATYYYTSQITNYIGYSWNYSYNIPVSASGYPVASGIDWGLGNRYSVGYYSLSSGSNSFTIPQMTGGGTTYCNPFYSQTQCPTFSGSVGGTTGSYNLAFTVGGGFFYTIPTYGNSQTVSLTVVNPTLTASDNNHLYTNQSGSMTIPPGDGYTLNWSANVPNPSGNCKLDGFWVATSGSQTSLGNVSGYSHTYTLTCYDVYNDPGTTQFTVNVISPSAISLSPASFSFAGVSGGATPTSQGITIANTGGSTLNWTAAASQPWCHIAPLSGSVSAGGNTLANVYVDAPTASLIGTNNCTITVSDPNASNSPQTAAVTYTVAAAPVCGTANGKQYQPYAGGFGSDTFCSNGSPSPSSPAFPGQGSTVSWICTNGGVSVGCGASTLQDNAQCVSVSAPSSVVAGQTFNSTITVKNIGTSTWQHPSSGGVGLYGLLDLPWSSSNPWGQTWENAIPAGTTVTPGSNYTFSNFPITAPGTPGTYNFDWQMVDNGVAWFPGSYPTALCHQAITVTSPPPGNPPAGTDCNSLQSCGGGKPACSYVRLVWTDSSGDETGFYIYRTTTSAVPALGGPSSPNYVVTVPKSGSSYTKDLNLGTDTTPYYYWVTAYNGGGESQPTTSFSPASLASYACQAQLGDSNKVITAYNGNTFTGASQPPTCGSNTPLPASISPKTGDILTFAINICNDQGSATATQISVTDNLTNLQQPTGASGFSASYNGTGLSYDGVKSAGYSPASGHYAAIGSSPNQQLVFNLSSPAYSVPPGAIRTLNLNAQLPAIASAGSRAYFQNSSQINFNNSITTSSVTPFTPLQHFSSTNQAPVIQEQP